MTSNRTGAVCGWVWSSRNENLQLQVGNHGCQPEKSGVPTRCQGAVTVPSRGVQVWCLVYSGSCLIVRGTRDWQMDWGGIRSDADAAPICCWEERAEHKANLSMYWSVYIPTLDWNTKHNLLKTRLCVQVTMVIVVIYAVKKTANSVTQEILTNPFISSMLHTSAAYYTNKSKHFFTSQNLNSKSFSHISFLNMAPSHSLF